jgi:hypothetical protein
VRKRVATPKARVRARHVVLAGSTGIGAVDAPLAETVLPVSTYVAVTAPLGEKLFEAVRYNGAIADTRRAGDYYRIVSDDRLMWGGRISTRESTPRRLKAMLRGDLLKVYPQLEGAEIEYAWSGTMAYAVHKMPQLGELGPGYWLASAFGGHGLNTTAMAGEMIARAILDGDDRWRLFSPYELVWTGGSAGRAAAQAMFWTTRARAALHEKIARYRDRARHEAEERERRYAEQRAARTAEEERLRAEEETRRKSEMEAKRLAAEEAARAAVERDRAEAERARVEAEATRRAEEAERRKRDDDLRAAAEKAALAAAEAARSLSKEIEDYRALTSSPETKVTPSSARSKPKLPKPETRRPVDGVAVGADRAIAVEPEPAMPKETKPRRKRTKKPKKKEVAASAAGSAPDVGG